MRLIRWDKYDKMRREKMGWKDGMKRWDEEMGWDEMKCEEMRW